MKCEICYQGPPAGPAIFRVNPLGQIGVWRCREHLTPEQTAAIDPEVKDIVGIIGGRSEKDMLARALHDAVYGTGPDANWKMIAPMWLEVLSKLSNRLEVLGYVIEKVIK